MSTNFFDQHDEALNHRIATGLTRIGLALKHHAWAGSKGRRLTPTQGHILTCLRRRSPATVRLSALADDLAITRATASDAVTTLVDKGLVEKSTDPADARAVGLRLTRRGEREAEQAAGWTEFLQAGIAALEPTEQATFLRGLVTIIRMLQERGAIPVAKMCVTCRYFRPNVHPDPERPHHCAFVDAPFGDRSLRLDCPDQEPAPSKERSRLWKAFLVRPTQGGGR